MDDRKKRNSFLLAATVILICLAGILVSRMGRKGPDQGQMAPDTGERIAADENPGNEKAREEAGAGESEGEADPKAEEAEKKADEEAEEGQEGTKDSGLVAMVSLNGQIVHVLDLDEEAHVLVGSRSGDYNVIRVKDQKVSVSEADCPDKVCVNTGEIWHEGDLIACLPHGLIIYLEREENLS